MKGLLKILGYLKGGKIAGGNPLTQRVDNDYYATDPKAVEMLLSNYNFCAKNILEPCVGGGNIANTILTFYDDVTVTGIDIVDRGFKNTIVTNYLEYDTCIMYDGIITNPPYSLAQEFIEKSIDLLDDDCGVIAMFLKIQFLESEKRRVFFEKYPPKYIYVFSKRMPTWNNGNEFTNDGKKWATTMCHAWFIWEKNNGEMSQTEPIVRWL